MMSPKLFSSCLTQRTATLLAETLTSRTLVQDLSQEGGITALLWLGWVELGKFFSLPLRFFPTNLANLINSKSQIALEYAYRRHERSSEISIFWVHASNASRFEQDYLQIAINAKLSGVNDPKQEIKQLVKNWLSSKESGTWLMIIDNADDSDMFFGARETGGSSLGSRRLSEFLPQCPNGSIIFITRNKKAGVKFATARGVIHLPKMDPVDAEELLKARLGEDISDRDGMTKLLELLEYLPLAISQAGSYIAENSISISKYLQMYSESEASRLELLSEDFEDPSRDPETKNPVAATWTISFDQIRQSDILAANLLSFMACLDRHKASQWLFYHRLRVQ